MINTMRLVVWQRTGGDLCVLSGRGIVFQYSNNSIASSSLGSLPISAIIKIIIQIRNSIVYSLLPCHNSSLLLLRVMGYMQIVAIRVADTILCTLVPLRCLCAMMVTLSHVASGNLKVNRTNPLRHDNAIVLCVVVAGERWDGEETN